MSARAHHAWRYDEDGLQVQIGTELQTYTRTTSKELRALVHSENVNRVPQGTLESYYTAQLLLYGLPPATSVAQAVQSFKSAFAGLEPGYKLKVTESIVAVTKALKAEYRARKQQEESRIQQIQDELDTIAAMKQKEVQLKHELCRPKPSLVSEQSSPSLTSTSGVQPQRESQGSAVPEMEEDLRPQSQKAVESPTKEKKKSKRSREGDHDIQEECSQPESKKIRTAEAPLKALETPPETQALSRLAYLFQGTWGLSDSTGKELNGGASPSIAIRKYYAKNGQGITLTAFVGLLELGDLSAYIAAEDLERTCHKIGPCLKTTFVWLTSPNEEGRPQEGTLDVFFNGCKIDGYLSGVSFERPVAFQGMLQPKNFTPKQAKEESRSLWEAFCSIRTSMKHHSEHTGLQHTSGEIENGTAH